MIYGCIRDSQVGRVCCLLCVCLDETIVASCLSLQDISSNILMAMWPHAASNPGRARAHADGAATQAIGQLPLGVKALNTHPVKSVSGVHSALMLAHIIVAPRLHLITLRLCPSYSCATTVSLLAASGWLSSTKGSMVNEISRCALPLAVPRARVCVLCCLSVQLHVCLLFVCGRPRGCCEAGAGYMMD